MPRNPLADALPSALGSLFQLLLWTPIYFLSSVPCLLHPAQSLTVTVIAICLLCSPRQCPAGGRGPADMGRGPGSRGHPRPTPTYMLLSAR